MQEDRSCAGERSARDGWDALGVDDPLGIPGHFPQMPVRILEVARVPTPKGVMRGLDHDCPCLRRLSHDGVDFAFGGDVVPKSERGRAGASKREPRIMRFRWRSSCLGCRRSYRSSP